MIDVTSEGKMVPTLLPRPASLSPTASRGLPCTSLRTLAATAQERASQEASYVILPSTSLAWNGSVEQSTAPSVLSTPIAKQGACFILQDRKSTRLNSSHSQIS